MSLSLNRMTRILVAMDPPDPTLCDWLAPHRPLVGPAAEQALKAPFDCAIIDVPAIERHREVIRRRHARDDLAKFPVILVVPRRKLAHATRHYAADVDALIGWPTTRTQFEAVLATQLHMRRRSLVYDEQCNRRAQYDPVTGLPAGPLSADRLAELIAERQDTRQPVSVVVIGFRDGPALTAGWGPSAEEALWASMARRLEAATPAGAVAGRLDDHTFVMLTPHRYPHEAQATVQHILRQFDRPGDKGRPLVHPRVHLGIAVYPLDGEDAATLIAQARLAAENAQAADRTAMFFTSAMTATAIGRWREERELREGLAEDAFYVHYQPIVDARTEDIVGAEALVRYRRADGTPWAPDAFIPIAEKTGLIIPLGARVLEEACRQGRRWHREGRMIRVSVNLSPRQMIDTRLVPKIARILSASGFDPTRLELEITETALMQAGEDARGLLTGLKDLGVRIFLDDFGTGYSSLGYLQRLPVDGLKIDRTFVAEVAHDAKTRAIVEAIIRLAEALRLEVVAEGVETVEQLDIMRRLGCTYLQGYYFGRPQPPEGFSAPGPN